MWGFIVGFSSMSVLWWRFIIVLMSFVGLYIVLVMILFVLLMYFDKLCIMMLVFNFVGERSRGVKVLLIIVVKFWLCVRCVRVGMFVIYSCGFDSDLKYSIFEFGCMVVCIVFKLFIFMNVVFML